MITIEIKYEKYEWLDRACREAAARIAKRFDEEVAAAMMVPQELWGPDAPRPIGILAGVPGINPAK